MWAWLLAAVAALAAFFSHAVRFLYSLKRTCHTYLPRFDQIELFGWGFGFVIL